MTAREEKLREQMCEIAIAVNYLRDELDREMEALSDCAREYAQCIAREHALNEKVTREAESGRAEVAADAS